MFKLRDHSSDGIIRGLSVCVGIMTTLAIIGTIASSRISKEQNNASQQTVQRPTGSCNRDNFRTEEFEVTAYCPCSKCCGKWAETPISSGKRRTASGHVIKVGDRFVAAPKSINFGTQMIIEGYNNNQPVRVEDRGGAITEGRLDLYFDNHQDALAWGRQKVKVKILQGE